MSSGERDAHRQAASDSWVELYRLFIDGIGQRRFHEACEATGLTPAVLKTLLQLDPAQPVSMGELAATFRCDPSYVTNLVDGLESAGLAERQLHPTDRRVKVVALTGLGITKQEDVRKILAEPPEAFGALSTAELEQLRRLLTKVLQASEPS
ncbi:MAG TPA: MarR family transcriptional regulator [Acidimicrobiales bacterium]|nr:MarR family transcriptional regulator [Acidimicrobiales bacterium]